jgi:hypothetical protein
MIEEPGRDRKHQTSSGISQETQIQQLRDWEKQLDEERARVKADEAQQRDTANRERDAAARERDAAARERQAVASEAAQLENERQRLTEEAKSLEEEARKKLEDENDDEDEQDGPQEPTESQLKARAKKDLRAVVDTLRRKHQRGVRLWRALSVLLLHLISLLIGVAIFVWKSQVLHSSPPSVTYRSDITFGAIILAVIFLLLLLEYMRNWRKHKKMLTKLEKIVVDLTQQAGDLSGIRTDLNKALGDYDSSFL